MKNWYIMLLTVSFVVNSSWATPYVVDPCGLPDPCFVVDKIMDRVDGQTLRLEVIRNPEYPLCQNT